jgi:hypothetical protein
MVITGCEVASMHQLPSLVCMPGSNSVRACVNCHTSRDTRNQYSFCGVFRLGKNLGDYSPHLLPFITHSQIHHRPHASAKYM